MIRHQIIPFGTRAVRACSYGVHALILGRNLQNVQNGINYDYIYYLSTTSPSTASSSDLSFDLALSDLEVSSAWA